MSKRKYETAIDTIAQHEAATRCTMKLLYIDHAWSAHTQHDDVETLRKEALYYARAVGTPIEYTIKTGRGQLVETGHIKLVEGSGQSESVC